MIRAALAVLLAVVTPALGGQEQQRTVTAARQLRDGDSLRVIVQHAAGPLRIRAAERAMLYDVTLRYAPARSAMVRDYDPETRTLRVGVDGADAGFRIRPRRGIPRDGVEHPNELTLALGRDVPLDLSLEFGASEAVIDLAELSVERLSMRFAASEARVSFGAPNPTRMRELVIVGGAAGFTARQLGNANAHRVEVRGVAAGLDLDLSGAWAHDMELDASVWLGGLVLRVPEDVGVRLISRRQLFGSLETPGYIERDGVRYSANWEQSSRKLTITTRAVLAGVEVRRVPR